MGRVVSDGRFLVRLTGTLTSQAALDEVKRTAGALMPTPIAVLNTAALTGVRRPAVPQPLVVERWCMNFLSPGVPPER